MNRRLPLTCIGWLCLCLLAVAASACHTEEEGIPATPTATMARGTAPAQTSTPAIPVTTGIAATGEEVERLVNTTVQRVTWEDGTTYEETIADLVFRTAGRPDAGRGYRTVARWLGDGKWQVTIFMRVVDRSTQPPATLDLQSEFYYDQNTAEFTAANGRAEFALTGRNPCPSPEVQSDYCPLDKEVVP